MSEELKSMKSKLEEQIKKSSNVFIIGHIGPDFDSIASAMGLYVFAKQFGKKVYIILDDDETKIETGVKKIIDSSRSKYKFINKELFEDLKDENSLLIVTDTNKKDLLSIKEDLEEIKRIVVIDHHDLGPTSIETPYRFINTQSSSASEMVAKLLNASRVSYSEELANYLLAGISLDTKRFKQNTTSQTHDIAKRLIQHGADIDQVNNLFLEEFESYCKISNLIVNGTAIKKYSESLLAPIQISFTLNRNAPKTIYQKEDLAKAADKMLKFNGIDASFSMGFLDDGTIHISARGNKRVNVGNIMKELSGGGNAQSAGSRIVSDDIFLVEQKLMDAVPVGFSDEVEVKDEPELIKLKQIKYKK